MQMDREIREERRNELAKERHYCVYAHINKINGKMYVGITRRKPEERWGSNGAGYSKQYKRYKHPFWNAIQKYGWNNFDHIIIASNLTREEACDIERVLIDGLDTYATHGTGYNINTGGNYGHSCKYRVLQFKLNGEFIKEFISADDAAMSVNLKRSGIVDACNGRLLSYKKYIWRYSKDVDNIEEESNRINKIYQEHSEFWEIYQFDMNGKFIIKWDNYFDIRREHKSEKWHSSAIKNACNRFSSSYGYVWRYAKDVPDIREFEKHYFEKYQHKHGSNKEVLCFDLSGNYITKYYSTKNACEATHINRITICRTAREKGIGRQYIFRYAIDLPEGFNGNIYEYENTN